MFLYPLDILNNRSFSIIKTETHLYGYCYETLGITIPTRRKYGPLSQEYSTTYFANTLLYVQNHMPHQRVYVYFNQVYGVLNYCITFTVITQHINIADKMRLIFQNKKWIKNKHGLQISGRMKSQHTIRKEIAPHAQGDCTAERENYQGTGPR